METTQDKLIREKLNSLDTLPEGYAPLLDSKWELLMAGQPEQKKQTPYFWYAAAASLLFFLGFAYRFLQLSTPEINNSIAIQNAPVNAEFKAEIPLKILPKALFEPREKTIARNLEKPENGRVLSVKIPVVKQISKPENHEIPEIEKGETLLPTTQNEAPAIAAETPKTGRKNKTKFVEMDFDSPETVAREPQNLETAQLTFKIKILPRENNITPSETQNEKLLRLQHTF